MEQNTKALTTMNLQSSKTFDLHKTLPKKERGPKPVNPTEILQQSEHSESEEVEVSEEIKAPEVIEPKVNPRHTAQMVMRTERMVEK
jgi:hypothetical protein